MTVLGVRQRMVFFDVRKVRRLVSPMVVLLTRDIHIV
jgi:hypothetical protein